MLGGHRLCWQLVQARGREGPHDCQVTIWLGDHVHWMPHHLVVQTPDYNSTVDHRSRVHCLVFSAERPDPNHATNERGHQTRD